jgi:hypothetical protein
MQVLERGEGGGVWASFVIDEALDKLDRKDREAVLLRFFQKQSFREIGGKLGASEDAVRMRVERALEKLREHLCRRGITSTTAALSAALAGQSVSSTPAGLSIVVAQAAAGISPAIPATTTVLKLMLTTKAKLGIVGIITAASVLAATREHIERNRIEAELTHRNTQAAVQEAQVESNSPPHAASEQSKAEHLEVMRLRAEVSRLRLAKQDSEKRLAEAVAEKAKEPQPSRRIRKKNE